MVLGSSPVAVTSLSDFAPASSKEFLDIQATIECEFTLKRVRDMTRTNSRKFTGFYMIRVFIERYFRKDCSTGFLQRYAYYLLKNKVVTLIP